MHITKYNTIQPIIESGYSKQLYSPLPQNLSVSSMQIVTIQPHTTLKRHYHNIQTELFIVQDNGLEVEVNSTSYLLNKHDVIVCEPKEWHNTINNTDKPLRYLVIKGNVPNGVVDTFFI